MLKPLTAALLLVIVMSGCENKPNTSTWITEHSEISEYEIYGERLIEATIERSKYEK